MNTLAPVNLTKISDDTLRRWQRYWMHRLYARGGKWLVEGMDKIASDELKKVEDAMIARGMEIERPDDPAGAA